MTMLTGVCFARCVEAEGAEEEYDQLSSLAAVSEDLGAAETEVRCAGAGADGRTGGGGVGRWVWVGCISMMVLARGGSGCV